MMRVHRGESKLDESLESRPSRAHKNGGDYRKNGGKERGPGKLRWNAALGNIV